MSVLKMDGEVFIDGFTREYLVTIFKCDKNITDDELINVYKNITIEELEDMIDEEIKKCNELGLDI